MTLDQLPDRRPVRRVGAPTGRPVEHEHRHGLPSRSLLVALVLACVALMVVDKAGGEDSPVAAARRAVGEVLGPVQSGVAAAVAPLAGLPDALRTNEGLRADLAAAESENDRLRAEMMTNGYDQQRIQEMRGLCRLAGSLGYALRPARVISLEPAQSFSDTVLLDAGSDAGLHPDMTVLNDDGLVGRITDVTSTTATVLLVTDPASTVGGRIGDNMEIGFVHGSRSDDGLDLQLADRQVLPEKDQAVLTWGSEGGAPYVAGVPIGTVSRVYESVRDTSYRAVIEPAVDFTTLDQVGVVVPSGTSEAVIEADGSCA